MLFPVAWTGAEQEKGACFNYINDPYAEAKISDLPECIAGKLHLHQQKAVTRVLKRNGRMILNDDLGVGKRLVAISVAIVYKTEWPLLIICPQVLQVLWKEEFVKWIPKFDVTKIQIFSGAPGEELRNNAAIYIVSYQNLLSA